MTKNIVTGQQIGLLGGPLYTTYKVFGAMYHARQTGGRAVYWLETNDADFSEINHLDYIDGENNLRTLTWDVDSQGYSCGLIEIDQTLPDLLTQFFDSLRQTEFTPTLRELAMRCYTPERTLGEASLELARELFGRFDIEFFDPSTPAFKDFMRPFLLREAERTPAGEQCNLFCMIHKRREAVFKTDDDNSYRLRDGTPVILDDYDLVPNIKTRPVCQDAYFQTQAYVAGPAEQEYLREFDDVYQFHGIQQAEIISRMSATLLEPKVGRLLKKYNLKLSDILALEKHELRQQTLKQHTGFEYKELQQQARQLTDEFLMNLRGVGIDLGKTGKQMHQLVKEQLGKLRADEKAKTETLLHAVENLSNMLLPFGQKQERMFNLFYYMNFYGGVEFIEWLYEHYDPALELLEVRYA